MRDELVCRTCETGRVHLVSRRRHGWLAGMFGSVLVVVSIASLLVWLVGLFAAFGKSGPVLSEIVPFMGAWLVTSLLVGIVGAIALHKESVLACSNCRAIMQALEEDEVEKPAPVEESAAPRARPST